jgi:hypothetical protein
MTVLGVFNVPTARWVMPKKVSVEAVKDESASLTLDSASEFVRVEDSIEGYISMMLPSVAGTKLQICPLWTDGSGKSYFRCKFWKQISDHWFVMRKETQSRFVCVTNLNGKRSFEDLTLSR